MDPSWQSLTGRNAGTVRGDARLYVRPANSGRYCGLGWKLALCGTPRPQCLSELKARGIPRLRPSLFPNNHSPENLWGQVPSGGLQQEAGRGLHELLGLVIGSRSWRRAFPSASPLHKGKGAASLVEILVSASFCGHISSACGLGRQSQLNLVPISHRGTEGLTGKLRVFEHRGAPNPTHVEVWASADVSCAGSTGQANGQGRKRNGRYTKNEESVKRVVG